MTDQGDIVEGVEQNVSKSPDYWRYAAYVDRCNGIINRYEDEAARNQKLADEWRDRRNEAIKKAEELARV